jgi:hypothetical protein
MDQETREYINGKFSTLIKALYWFGGIFLTITMASIGFTVKLAIQTSEDVAILKFQRQQVQNNIIQLEQTLRTVVQLTELTREITEKLADDRNYSNMMDQIDTMEKDAMRELDPSYRGGGSNTPYSDQIKKYME